MIRLKKMLANRLAKTGLTAGAAFGLMMVGSSTAHAAIYWSGIQLVNQASQQCLDAEGSGFNPPNINNEGTTSPGCMAAGTSWIWLWSAAPDSGGDAYVQIQTDDPHGDLICLAAADPGTPTEWEICDSGNARQIWRMQTVAPPQNVGNPAGLRHYIGFWNPYLNACLDGGYNLAYSGVCTANDGYQVWNVYTNQGSQPYGG